MLNTSQPWNAICSNMDATRDYHIKWSQKENTTPYHSSMESKIGTDEPIYKTKMDWQTEIKHVLARATCCVRAGLLQPCHQPALARLPAPSSGSAGCRLDFAPRPALLLLLHDRLFLRLTAEKPEAKCSPDPGLTRPKSALISPDLPAGSQGNVLRFCGPGGPHPGPQPAGTRDWASFGIECSAEPFGPAWSAGG